MNRIFYVILILIIFNFKTTYSQRTENAIYFSDKNSRIVLEIDNDMLFNTDSYYTSGQALSYTNKSFTKTPTQLILNLIIKKDVDITGIGFQQRIYTPYSIELPNAIDNDRPYSAYILLTNYSVFINVEHKVIFSNELGIGVMGPAALGEQSQSFIHKLIGSPEPIGWENQLNNTFLIDYTFRLEKSFFKGFIAEHFIPYAETRIGTLTDHIKLGIKLRVGNKNKSVLDLVNKRTTERKLSWEWILGANLQGVFYDATLEGGLFKKDEILLLPKRDIIEQQYQFRMGINIYYKRVSFRYMINYNSKNFTNSVIHKYGSANFGFAF